jgi:hypothetical protein
VRRRDQQNGIAIRRRPRDDFAADDAARTRTIIEDQRLTEIVADGRLNQTRDAVGAAARREGHNAAHRFRGEAGGLRPCRGRYRV